MKKQEPNKFKYDLACEQVRLLPLNAVQNKLKIYQQIIAKQAEITALIEQLQALNPELTPDQKKPSKKSSFALLKSLGITDGTAKDYIEHRKIKKAAITETSLRSIEREGIKCGLCLESTLIITIERNWQGFKAEWYQQPVNKQSTNNTFFDSLNSLDF